LYSEIQISSFIKWNTIVNIYHQYHHLLYVIILNGILRNIDEIKCIFPHIFIVKIHFSLQWKIITVFFTGVLVDYFLQIHLKGSLWIIMSKFIYLSYTNKWNIEKYWWNKMCIFIFRIFTVQNYFSLQWNIFSVFSLVY
jgi:hypothetical protein